MAKVHGDEQLKMLLKGVAHLLTTIPVVGRKMPATALEPHVNTERPQPGSHVEKKMLLCLRVPTPLYADLLALEEYLPDLATTEIGIKAMEIGIRALMREEALSHGPVIVVAE